FSCAARDRPSRRRIASCSAPARIARYRWSRSRAPCWRASPGSRSTRRTSERGAAGRRRARRHDQRRARLRAILGAGRHRLGVGRYMRKMIAETKAKGATPIVLSLSVRNLWKDGQIERGSGRYGAWSAALAREAGVRFIDLTDLVADSLQRLGPERTKAMYVQDYVHFNAEGADLHARTVVSALKALRPSAVPRTWLSAKGDSVRPDPLVGLGLSWPADRTRPTLFLVGNSTVRNGRGDGAGGQWGWGDFIAPWFDTTRINVVNRAVGGLSARTFISQGYWDRVLALVKQGDFVMVEFGHNDASPVNDTLRARGVLRGIGRDSVVIDNLIPKQRGEVVYTF